MTASSQTRMSPRHMVFAILVASVWGIAFVLSKVGLESFTPPQLTLLRFTCAAVGVLWLPRPAISWKLLILIALTLFTGQFLLQFFGMAMGMPAGLTAVVAQAQAPLTVLLAVCVLGDRPSRQQIVGMVVALTGLIAISLTLGHGVPLAAFLVMLASALSWSVGNVLVKRIGKVDMLHLMVWASLIPPLPAFILTMTLDGSYQRAWGILQFERTAIGALLWAERERALTTGRKRSIEYYIMGAVDGTLEHERKNIVPMMIPDLDVGPPTEQGALMQQRYRAAVGKAGSAYK